MLDCVTFLPTTSYLCEVRFLVVAVIKSQYHVKIIVVQEMSDGVQGLRSRAVPNTHPVSK